MGQTVAVPPRAAVDAPPAQAEIACRQCGLAVRPGDEFCCYGCEIAAQIVKEGAEEHGHTKAAMLFSLLLSMTVMMLSLFLFSEDVYGVDPAGGMGWLAEGYRWASGVLSAPVVYLLGVPLARRALAGLTRGRLGMDLLVAAGAFAAFGLSVHALLAKRRGVYFDSATSALLLATLGRYLEARGRANAARLLGPLLGRASESVLVAPEADPDAFARKSPALIAAGDRVRIEAEEMLPVDAVLVSGEVSVNLGVLTGESLPVTRVAGDELPAGAVPISGAMVCRALRPAAASTLERLAALSRSLASNRGSLGRWADRFAAVLTPVVFAAAFATLALHAHADTIDRGLVAALAVVLAACPCTYGAATPLVLWLALRKALRHGVLVRSADTLEALAAVRAVAFDKTGTLTPRVLVVDGVDLAPGADRGEVAALVAALEGGSKHPVGAALAAFAGAENAAPAAVTEKRSVPGRGVRARDGQGRVVLLGAPAWIAGEIDRPAESGPQESARVVLAVDGAIAARFHVGETVREEARSAIDALRKTGVSAWMLTGDAEHGARHVARALGIEAAANLAAADKVTAMKAAGDAVAMVGDGLNDAPALAGASVGFAVEGSTDLARGMARVVLLRPDLRLVPWTLALARRAVQLAKRNLIASTIYNLLFLGLAAAGALRPVWAGLSMAASSLFLLASAGRISGFAAPDPARDEEPAT